MNERSRLRSMSSILSVREHRLLRLRFVDGLTQREAAVIVGKDQASICRMERAALQKLREAGNFVVDVDAEYCEKKF
jgi:RNA polymerase sigma factor (sigma-70 family)